MLRSCASAHYEQSSGQNSAGQWGNDTPGPGWLQMVEPAACQESSNTYIQWAG